MRRLLLGLLLALGLAGCAAEPVEQELAGTGNSTAQGIVESFLDDLNAALADPSIARVAGRRSWA